MCATTAISLGELASELLLSIFKHLCVPDLLNLKLTCWRFNSIINSFWDQLLFQRHEYFLVTNQQSEYVKKRSQKILCSFEKHRISTNWQIGRYGEKNIFLSTKFTPCFYLEKDLLWLSRGCHIKCFERRGCKINLRRPIHNLNGFKSSHICKFAINNDHILTGNGSQKILCSFEKHRISTNWQIGRYGEKNIFLSTKFTPCFYLEKDLLWLSRGCHIKCFERRGCKINLRRPIHNLNGFKSSHICKFAINNDHILTGNGNGLRLYSFKNKNYIFDMNLPDMEITCVDMKSDLVAVGSRNNSLCLYHNIHSFNPVFVCKEIYDDRVWSVALNTTKLAIGTAANNSLTSLIIFDVETCKSTLQLGTGQRGAGILIFKWESPSLLWSGGYDSFLRRWDIRMGQCVQSFPDPWFSKIYCFDCDFINTFITGCESNGRAVLWDIRKDKYIQMYYLKSCNRSSSPIYSLAFDPEHLFAVTELHMNILDFSVIQGSNQDYSDIFKVQIVI